MILLRNRAGKPLCRQKILPEYISKIKTESTTEQGGDERGRLYEEGKMKAVVSITIDEEFVVHDIKVIEGEKGLFIAMPSRKATDGEYRDIAHPINSATRERIQNIILEKYEQVLAEEPVEESVE